MVLIWSLKLKKLWLIWHHCIVWLMSLVSCYASVYFSFSKPLCLCLASWLPTEYYLYKAYIMNWSWILILVKSELKLEWFMFGHIYSKSELKHWIWWEFFYTQTTNPSFRVDLILEVIIGSIFLMNETNQNSTIIIFFTSRIETKHTQSLLVLKV